jgi:hypothetical protein
MRTRRRLMDPAIEGILSRSEGWDWGAEDRILELRLIIE